MQKFFFPAQTDFFDLFHKIAEELLIVAQQFQELLNNLNNPENFISTIEIHEQRACHIINMTLEKLHKTFITPFDRYDIHRFVKKLDDTVNAVQRTCKRIVIYKLRILPQELYLMASLCLQAAEAIHSATDHLSSLSNSSKILELCDTVNDLESKAEVVLLKGVSQLFEDEPDIRQLLKIKEIYEYAKSTLNSCQIVSNIIKDIVLEYS
jgi:uncharacterized protein Yka (UPF0111/DUF47 family)